MALPCKVGDGVIFEVTDVGFVVGLGVALVELVPPALVPQLMNMISKKTLNISRTHRSESFYIQEHTNLPFLSTMRKYNNSEGHILALL